MNDIIQKLVEKLCEGNTKNVMAVIENVNIFRKFCNLLNVEKTYMSICAQVLVYKDTRFIEQIVHVLNYILVTYEVRII
jgi:hypothetical protein